MENKNTVVAVFSDHVEAEAAVKQLQKSGYDMKQLSIVGKDYPAGCAAVAMHHA